MQNILESIELIKKNTHTSVILPLNKGKQGLLDYVNKEIYHTKYINETHEHSILIQNPDGISLYIPKDHDIVAWDIRISVSVEKYRETYINIIDNGYKEKLPVDQLRIFYKMLNVVKETRIANVENVLACFSPENLYTNFKETYLQMDYDILKQRCIRFELYIKF